MFLTFQVFIYLLNNRYSFYVGENCMLQVADVIFSNAIYTLCKELKSSFIIIFSYTQV